MALLRRQQGSVCELRAAECLSEANFSNRKLTLNETQEEPQITCSCSITFCIKCVIFQSVVSVFVSEFVDIRFNIMEAFFLLYLLAR